ncbi:MAG: phosphoesterase [Synechococcaceae bacterium WB8_1B_057]|nr:phosphoesterase [Synechococcaceae bacterium WB8_1B_057]
MKVQLVSDLHLEFSDINIANQNDTDVLILGGDIMIAQDLHDHPENDQIMDLILGTRREKAQRFRNFLKRVSLEFPHVIYIAGNHEFYHGKYPAALDYLKIECEPYNNIHFLNNSTFFLGDVTFIGSTLWTDMNKGDPLTMHTCGEIMNDYKVIRRSDLGYRKLRVSDTVIEHKKSLRYIEEVLKYRNNDRFVVVGHHAPTPLSTKPRYQGDYQLNGAYSSDLSDFILDHPQIKVWTHGHTHDVFDYMVGDTRIVCNPRGYEGFEPDSGWDPNFYFEV